MGEPRSRIAPRRQQHVAVVPPLDRSEVVFLAGFGRRPVTGHDGRAVETRHRVARIWPGQPATPSPWVPCAEGCCLEVGSVGVPGAAGQWLRFLIDTFLAARHRVDGTAEIGSPLGGARALVMVEGNDVFEGEADCGDDLA